jgi:hypothetical protein
VKIAAGDHRTYSNGSGLADRRLVVVVLRLFAKTLGILQSKTGRLQAKWCAAIDAAVVFPCIDSSLSASDRVTVAYVLHLMDHWPDSDCCGII